MSDSTFREIEETLNGASQENTAQLMTDIRFEQEIFYHKQEENLQYERRNKLYSGLLEKYIEIYAKKERMKMWYRGIFFGVTMVLFAAIIFGCLDCIKIMLKVGNSDVTNISAAVSSAAGIIATIIILPKIIAEHLFPTDEEEKMLEMVKNMQSNDANIRELINKDEYNSDEQKSEGN